MPSSPSERTRTRAGAPLIALLLVALAALGLVACSSDDDSSSSTTEKDATTTTADPADAELTVLVTNDDGVKAPGIDTLVQALIAVPNTKVIVAAPAENQSGSGGSTTPGGAPATPSTTASGYEATSVAGFPADSVVWALDGGIDVTPDLVISGINSGQNIGKLIEVSGTVGAARAAATRGVPSLAVSAGFADQPDFATAATLTLDWVAEHRVELLSGDLPKDPAPAENLNVPTCTAGAVRGTVEVPVDTTSDVKITPVDCTAGGDDPTTDLEAFDAGFAPLSELTVPAPAAAGASTTTTVTG